MREQELQKYEQELNCVKTTNEGKVDKALIKNLFLGYFHLPSGKRSEGIRLIGKVLSFNEEEMKQAGVDGGGWLTGMTGMFRKSLQVGPPKSPGSSPGTPSFDKSFSELFVNFLEQESTPTIAARLPMDQMIQEQQQKQQQKHHQPFNPFAPIPAGHAANSQTVPTPSGGGLVSLTGDPRESHLLMAPLTPSLPTFNPIIPSVTPSSGRGSAASSSGRSTPASSSILRDVLQQS